MDNKIELKKVKMLFLISWAAAAIFAFLFLFTQAKNVKLNTRLFLTEQKLKSAGADMADYVRAREASVWEKNAVDYIEWQFVLKSEVNIAGLKILNEINQIKDIRNNKNLANVLYNNLGLAYTMSVDFDSAIKAFESAVSLKPYDSSSLYCLGLLYSVYRADKGKAIKYYNKFLEVEPKSPKAGEVKERIAALKK